METYQQILLTVLLFFLIIVFEQLMISFMRLKKKMGKKHMRPLNVHESSKDTAGD